MRAVRGTAHVMSGVPLRVLGRRSYTAYKSHRKDIEIPDKLFGRFILETQLGFGDKVAMVDTTTSEAMTHAQLYSRVLSVASSLLARGFKPGDVAFSNLPNKLEYPVMMLAIQLIGGIFTPGAPQATVSDIERQLRASRARWVITDNIWDNDESCALSPRAIAAAKAAEIPSDNVFVVGAETWADLLKGGEGLDLEAIEYKGTSEDVTHLPFSSGTTGPPKGVMLTHRNIIANCLQIEEALPVDDWTFYGVLPFYHIYPHCMHLSYALRFGIKSAIMPRFNLEGYLKGIQEQKVDFIHVAPPIAVLLCNSPLVQKYDISSLKVIASAAAPLGPEIEAELIRKLGVKVIQCWGLSELSPIATFIPTDQWNRTDLRGSCGTVVANTEFCIVDPKTKEEVKPGEGTGEVWIRGPQVMKGYWENPEATAGTVTEDGWLKTGDLVKANDDGYLWIVDRIKEMIKYKGHQIAPAELEEVLLSHPEVADCAVISSVDAAGEEVPKGYVVLAQGLEKPPTEAELMKWFAEQVAPYKKIRAVEFIDVVPKTASGKLLRRVLVEKDRAERAEKAKASSA